MLSWCWDWGLAGVKSLLKELLARSLLTLLCSGHNKKCPPNFWLAAPSVLRGHPWYTWLCQAPDPVSCDQWIHEKSNCCSQNGALLDPTRLQSTMSDRKTAFIHRVLLQSEDTKRERLLNQTTQPGPSCASHYVLGARAGLWLFALQQGFSAPAAAETRSVSSEGPWAGPPGSAWELQQRNVRPPASPFSNNATKKIVLWDRRGLNLPGMAGKSAPLSANNSSALLKEMGYGKRLD